MKELLEVCLYAMDYLQVGDIRTEMMFVLRDQGDRNTKVQSDSLTLMRKMLREAMGSGQKNLDDLVSLKHDAIFLLPSAFSEVKQEERTVESSSAAFSEEAIALRQKILQSTLGDRLTLDSPDDSEPLITWYRHACIVWNTLTKYGYTLLHYKALHELHLHKEINEIVTSLVKQSENKFNDQARVVVKKHTERLQTVKDETSVLMYDKECQSELTSLKRATHEELVHYFEQRTQAKKYNEDLKKEFRCKLATPLSSAYDIHTYSWLRQLHLAKHRLNKEAFDRNFYVQLDGELTRTGYQSSLSMSDAAKIFGNLWKQYESKHRKRLLETRKTNVDVEAEVLTIFRHVWERHQHNEILAVVSSAFRLTTLSKSTDFVNSIDNIWVKKYLKTKSTVIQKAWDMFYRRQTKI